MTARAVRDLVRIRAQGRCEYCRVLQEEIPLAAFHVEHIVPRQHGGADDPDNLALACNHCNLHKGPNLTGIDPETGSIVPLFNPRREAWDDHFSSKGPEIIGQTPTGRATARVLGMNAPTRIELRTVLRMQGYRA